MIDIVTDAIILKKEFLGDFNAVYTFFTKDYGKTTAKATSVRKITSKLAAHLEPGLISKVRLVAKKGSFGSRSHFQVVDSLLQNRLFSDHYFLDLVSATTLPLQSDNAIWEFLLLGDPNKKKLMAICGFGEDPACISCGLPAVTLYYPDQEFMCRNCSSRIPQKLVTNII